nr:hypothetical protein [Tanacetum cinerariifolium]
MHADLKYVDSLKKEIDELESDKDEFSNMYDMILKECVSHDVMCSYLLSLSDLDALAELQCLYLHKVKECDYLAQKLSKQTESVSKEVHNELLQCFAKVEKHSISLEIALQKCKEQVKNDTVWNEKASNVFRKEHEQYIEIQDLKAQLQGKNIFIRVNHKTNVSRPHHRRNQLKYKVVLNNSQVKPKKTQVEEHPRIPSIANKMKSVTACKDSLNSKTLNTNKSLNASPSTSENSSQSPLHINHCCYECGDPLDESDELIKSSVENLIPIPSESEGIPKHMCDVPFHDNSLPLDISKDQIEDLSESNEEFSSIDDDSFSIDNIDYVEASPLDSELVSSEVMKIVILEVERIDDDILLMIKDDTLREKLLNVNLLIAKIEALNDNPTLSFDCKTKSSSTSLNSLLEETNTSDNS